MKIHIIRDSSEARLLLAQGLWWQRVLPPTAHNIREVLQWAKEAASGGQPLPPIGFVGDLGHVALGEDWEMRSGKEPLAVPNLPMNLVRTYEDHVLGKIYSDWTFTRGSDALRRYSKENREQARGFAYLLGHFRERARYDGLEISLGVLNTLLDTPAEEILTEGWESLRQDGPHPLLPLLYQSLIDASRRTPEVLGPDDIFDLERRYALEDFSQQLAHRQVLRAADHLTKNLRDHEIKPAAGAPIVPTRISDEDLYPIGGFTSISNRGSIESLLHSQLAFMEVDSAERPDLFDTLFLLDELLYYSRDDNQFHRTRRTFGLVLCADLVKARFKDNELPFQRGVMLQGLLYQLVEKIRERLGDDDLRFHILTLNEGQANPLEKEIAIFQKLFFEGIALDQIAFAQTDQKSLEQFCHEWSRTTEVRVLIAGMKPPLLEVRDVGVTRLAIESIRPTIGIGTDELEPEPAEDALEAWEKSLKSCLSHWIKTAKNSR